MGLQQWVANIAITKGIKKAAQAGVAYIVAFLATPSIDMALRHMGIDLNIDPVVATGFVTAALMGALEFLRNWLKVKVGFKWL